MKVLIIGSSHVVRVKEYVDPPTFGLSGVTVDYLSKSGLKFSDVQFYLDAAKKDEHQFDVLFVQSAGNDLRPAQNSSLSTMTTFVSLLHAVIDRFKPKILIIGELLHRGVSRHLPELSLARAYNREADKLNQLLRELAETELGRKVQVTVWRHKRLYSPNQIESDGTHLTPRAMRQFARSIRGALIEARSTVGDNRTPRGFKYNETRVK